LENVLRHLLFLSVQWSLTPLIPSILLRLLFPAICCLAHAAALGADHDGDVNIDGGVDVVDLLWGEQALQGARSLLPAEEVHADVAPLVSGVPAPDGMFNLGDLLVILRIALGELDFSLPGNQFNIGDSIGEGEAADGTIGEAHHETVWSTGYKLTDSVNSLNERFEVSDAAGYYENNAIRDPLFNHAQSGAVMADFAAQAQGIVAAAAQTPSGNVEMATVFLGNNDVCAESMGQMTDPALFEAQYRAGLDVLASSSVARTAQIHVSGIPAIYWLWNARYSEFWCRVVVWPLVPCENLLDNPSNDCENSTSRQDPDIVYPGDGANCRRRKALHALIRDTYNPILRDVLDEYRTSEQLPNARYTDIYDVRFDSAHVNGGDCFHPNTTGHALLAQTEWCRSHWGNGDAACP
jgi:lysophospholipase L1-like esterase